MSRINEATSRSHPGRWSCTVHLSRDCLSALYSEFQKTDRLRHRLQSEATGLIFGEAAPRSVQLEQVEAGEWTASSVLERESVRQALEERISRARSSAPHSTALRGWYVVRRDNEAQLLERDIDFHNTFFRSPDEVAVIVRGEAQGFLSVAIYASKPGALLSSTNYLAGSWSTANASALPDHVDLELRGTESDELFLNVYKTAKSLDQAENVGPWEKIRKHTARIIPPFGAASPGFDQEARIGTNLSNPVFVGTATPAPLERPTEQARQNLPGIPRSPTETPRFGTVQWLCTQESAGKEDAAPPVSEFFTPDRHLLSAPHERPEMQPPLPLSTTAHEVSEQKRSGLLRGVAWLLGTMVISILTYVAAHVYLKPLLLKTVVQTSQGVATAPPETGSSPSVFDLTVTQAGTTFDLRWNPRSPVMQHASSAKLVIQDGTATREVDMDPSQLRSGRIVYTPQSGDIQFSLAVMDTAWHVTTDSIRVLGMPAEKGVHSVRPYGGNNMPLQERAPHRAPAAGPRPAAAPLNSSQERENASILPAPHPGDLPASSSDYLQSPLIAQSVPPISRFRNLPGLQNAPPSQNQSLQSLEQALQRKDRIDLSWQNLPLSAHSVLRLRIPPSANPKSASSTPPPSFRPQVPGSSALGSSPQTTFSPSVALYRKYPTFHGGVLSRNLLVSVIVRIDERGKVTSVSLAPAAAKVPGEVSSEALTAARGWRFSPAKVGGKPVSSEMRINFLFKPSPQPDAVTP